MSVPDSLLSSTFLYIPVVCWDVMCFLFIIFILWEPVVYIYNRREGTLACSFWRSEIKIWKKKCFRSTCNPLACVFFVVAVVTFSVGCSNSCCPYSRQGSGPSPCFRTVRLKSRSSETRWRQQALMTGVGEGVIRIIGFWVDYGSTSFIFCGLVRIFLLSSVRTALDNAQEIWYLASEFSLSDDFL